jgi:zinc metalloprotease ZmpA
MISFIHKLGKRICRLHRARTTAWTLAITALALIFGVAPIRAQNAPGDRARAIERARGHVAANPAVTHFGPDQELVVRDALIDTDGTEHVRFDRTYRGLRVVGGDLVVHSSANGLFTGVSQTLTSDLSLSTQPSLAPGDARREAIARFAGYRPSESLPELIVFARSVSPVLAYDIVIIGQKNDGTPSELHVIVDAASSDVLESWDDIHTGAADGSGQGFFNGIVALTTNSVSTGFELRDPSRGNQYTIDMKNKQGGTGSMFTDLDNKWGDGTLSNRQTVGVDAQYGTAMTWDYYETIHGRTGIANDGKGAYNRVHYGRNYNNAFWSDSCFCMTYGDGDGKTFNPFDSLDVAGHEMSHGVTSRTANLTYSGESGGLNEGTSDIFGAMVEFYANNANDTPDYLIGEELYKSGTKALRYMYHPSIDGGSSDCWYSGVGSLDVHYSSGVANHFYYLLAEGTNPSDGPSSPTCNSGDKRQATGGGIGSLVGIGRADAEKIWYRALTVYMTSSTNYAGARTATLNAASDLFGIGSAQYNAVAAAWAAVNVH